MRSQLRNLYRPPIKVKTGRSFQPAAMLVQSQFQQALKMFADLCDDDVKRTKTKLVEVNPRTLTELKAS